MGGEGGAGHLVRCDVRPDQTLGASSWAIPMWTRSITGSAEAHGQPGPAADQPKAAGPRIATAEQIVARLKRKIAGVEGITVSMQVRQDIQVGGRISAAQYQYTLQDADVAELNKWSTACWTKLSDLPQLRDVTSDRQASATSATLDIDRPTAARLGMSTARSTICCMTPSASARSRPCSRSSTSITYPGSGTALSAFHGRAAPPLRRSSDGPACAA